MLPSTTIGSALLRNEGFVAELLRVLIVDADADNASTLAIVLGLSGHQVDLASDVHQALKKLSAKMEPDIIVVDLPFPIQSEWKAAAQLQKQAGRRPYVIAITEPDAGGVRRTARAGIDLHLARP